MSISTEVNAALFEDIEAGIALNNNFPLFAEDEVEVVYGSQGLKAVYPTDFTVELFPNDYDSFTVTPTSSLIAKIEALIADPPTTADETNFVVVRRVLDNTTDVEPETIRVTSYLSREIDRIHMKLIGLAEGLARAVSLPATVIGDTINKYTIGSPSEGKAPVWRGNSLVAEIDAANIAAAEENAATATAAAATASAAAISAAASAASLPLNNYTATRAPNSGDDSADGYSVGSEWVNLTTGNKYLCVLATVGAADWRNQSADLSSLGTAAYQDVEDFATDEQGEKADTAIQPGSSFLTALDSAIGVNDTFKTSGLTYANGTVLEIAHDLGVAPDEVNWHVTCTSADQGFAVGQRIYSGSFVVQRPASLGSSNTYYGMLVYADTAKVYFKASPSGIIVQSPNTGVWAALTPTKWTLSVTARA